jgi:hypothetical protein
MVTANLVEPKIEGGANLLQALDQAGVTVTSALWLYDQDSEVWRLLIATPLFDEFGPMEAYRRIQEVLAREQHSIDLLDISARSPSDAIIEAIHSAVQTVPGISQIWFTGSNVNGVHINDAYIYRLT